MKLNRIVSAALKRAFVAEKSIQKMAKEDFIMLNLVVIEDLLYMEELFSTAIQYPNMGITALKDRIAKC